jgi:hypothetical protein
MSTAPKSLAPSLARPLISWLGEQASLDVSGRLQRHAELHRGWHPDAEVLVVQASLGINVLERLPTDRPLPTIVAVSSWIPTPEEIRTWRSAGAADIVSLDRLFDTILDHLEEGEVRPTVAVDLDALAAIDMDDANLDPSRNTDLRTVDSRADSVAAAELAAHEAEDFRSWTDPGLLEEALTDAGEDRSQLPPTAEPGPVSASAMGQLRMVRKYLSRRAIWLAGRGLANHRSTIRLDAFLALCRLRETMAEDVTGYDDPRPDVYGLISGQAAHTLAWSAKVRPPVIAPGAFPLAGEPTTIQALGSDGLVFSFHLPPKDGTRLVLEIDGATEGHADILVECRHFREYAPGRWQVAAIILEVELS